MIVDSQKNLRKYAALLPYLESGLAKLASLGSSPAEGRYDFEHGFLLVQEGTTTPLAEGTFEAHREFIDVQLVMSGAEEIAWLDYDDATASIAYDKETDKERLDGPRTHHMLVTEGMFWVAFPQDAHKAIAHVDEPHGYRKVVMKLPVER